MEVWGGRGLVGKDASEMSPDSQEKLLGCCSFKERSLITKDSNTFSIGTFQATSSARIGAAFETTVPIPWCLGVILFQRVQLLLHPLPALQTAPEPVGIDDMEVIAALRLTNLLCACSTTKKEKRNSL